MPHLTIFGMHYAPERAGNAPYTTSFAEHAAANGWDVTVETGVPHYPEWERQDAPTDEVINGVRVHRNVHHVPSQPTAMRRGAMDATWAASVTPAIIRNRADVVMGVVPNLTGGWVARLAARRARVPWVLWFQDLMGQAAVQSGVEGGSRVAGAVRRTELAAARKADAVIVVADGFRRYLEDGGVLPERIHVVRNWSLLARSETPRTEARAHFGFAPGDTVAVHSGNMGAKQGLEVVIDAAALAPDVTFILQGNGSERSTLEEGAISKNLDNVRFLPSLEDGDLADLLIAADVLLLTQRPSVTDMSLPSKLTTYFTTHTPIVASINPDSEAARLLTAADRGTVAPAGDTDAFVEAIRTMAAAPATTRSDGADLFGSPTAIERILADTLASS
jgi:putative colanic acid biosynthesis glycosyltransferase WcaI